MPDIWEQDYLWMKEYVSRKNEFNQINQMIESKVFDYQDFSLFMRQNLKTGEDLKKRSQRLIKIVEKKTGQSLPENLAERLVSDLFNSMIETLPY